MQFQKGQSGNPAGRPPGRGNRVGMLVQEMLEMDAEPLIAKLREMAQDGHFGALRMCLDRIAPVRKYQPGSCELPRIETGADAVEAMTRITNAVTAGDLAPSEAGDLAKVVEVFVQARSLYSFEERLNNVERLAAEKKQAARSANGGASIHG